MTYTIFCLIEAARSGKSIIRVLSEDKRVWPPEVLGVRGGYGCTVQIERWDVSLLGHIVCSSMACMPSAYANAKIYTRTPCSLKTSKANAQGKWARRHRKVGATSQGKWARRHREVSATS